MNRGSPTAKVVATALAVALLFVLPLGAMQVPHLSGQVVDLARIIPDGNHRNIVAKLEALEARTGAQVAVLTVPSLEGKVLEQFTIEVLDTWQLGQGSQDNGILLFVAQKERRLRLEVGYGLEPVLSDALSRRILDNIVTPAFRGGDFGGGLERAVDAIIAVIGGEGEPPGLKEAPKAPASSGCFVMFLFLLFFVVLPTLGRGRFQRRGWSSRRGWSAPWIIGSGGGRSGWGGGSFGGFSGGGGGFGGGGASGGW